MLRRRPDIRAVELSAVAQSERIGIARSDLYPSFSLIGSLGTQTSAGGDSPRKVREATELARQRRSDLEIDGEIQVTPAMHSDVRVPEFPFSIERVCAYVESRFQAHYAPIIVVAEGATPDGGENATVDKGLDAFGHVRLGGIGEWLAGEIEKRTGKEARTTVLGHIQRGGTPTAFDRWLATRFGLQAIGAVHDGDFGTMMALRGTSIARVPLSEGTAELKLVSPEEYAEAEVFFG